MRIRSRVKYFLFFNSTIFGLLLSLSAFSEAGDFDLYRLRSFRQAYDSSINLMEIQESLSEYDCVFGVPIDIYDPKIIHPQGCHVLLLQHCNGDKRVKVVFKPRDKLTQVLSVGAFYMAHYLGMGTMLPPIASFVYKGQEGIISYYIDTALTNSFWDISGDYVLIKQFVDSKALSDYYIFSYLVGNWDLKWKNVLLFNNQGVEDIVCVDIDAIASPGAGCYGEHFFVPLVKASEIGIPYSKFEETDAYYLEKSDIDFYLDSLFPFFSRKRIHSK